jgi:predicted enzyme related to lactoylglutathione lyase
MDFKLEVVVAPVADVDRAKAFYQCVVGESDKRAAGS